MDGYDQITLRGLRVRGHHGVLPTERENGQDFVVDVVAHLDTRAAAMADDLTQTVDYGRLAQELAAVVAGEPVALLETLAERLAVTVLAHPLVAQVDLTVHKPDAPIPLAFEDVSVSISRLQQ